MPLATNPRLKREWLPYRQLTTRTLRNLLKSAGQRSRIQRIILKYKENWKLDLNNDDCVLTIRYILLNKTFKYYIVCHISECFGKNFVLISLIHVQWKSKCACPPKTSHNYYKNKNMWYKWDIPQPETKGHRSCLDFG